MISGKWYPEGRAKQYPASLLIQGSSYTVSVKGLPPLIGPVKSLKISDRIGNAERKLTLADGSLFATLDNDSLDKLLAKKSAGKHLIYRLESNLLWVCFALIFVIAFAVTFVKWGVPVISHEIAQALPYETDKIIGEHTLEVLDEHIFEPSGLNEKRQAEIRENFQSRIALIQPEPIAYQLHFRQWEINDIDIPNALALPSGDIILTDRFVKLAKSDDEIDAVLLHEMGHVVHRHSLEAIVQRSFISTVVMMVLGDTNGIVDIAVGVGTGLITSSYSRKQESEADLYAFQKMLIVHIDPRVFSAILHRIEDDVQQQIHSDRNDSEHHEKQKEIIDYFASHPSTSERAEVAEKFARCYDQGVTLCAE